MNLLVALAIVVAAAGLAALLMVAVRRRVPAAEFFPADERKELRSDLVC